MKFVTSFIRRLIIRPLVTAGALTIWLGLAMTPSPAFAIGAPGMDAVRSLYDTLLNNMKNGPTLGPRGRYDQVEPVVRRLFDIPSMARLAVGPQWASLTDAQHAQVTQAFGRYIAAIYADRFDNYAGERLQVIGEQPSLGGVMVTSRIVQSDGQPVNINYLVRQNGGTWQIADVYLDGTISELATRRSEFAEILRSRGIDGLISALNIKADALSAARAS